MTSNSNERNVTPKLPSTESLEQAKPQEFSVIERILNKIHLNFFTPIGRRNCFILAGVVGLLVWSPLFANQFIMWDDDFNLYQNPIMLNGSWTQFWAEPYMGFYIPLTYTIWHIMVQIFGVGTSLHFEILNLTFHMVNSVLLYFYMKVLLEKLHWPSFDPGPVDRKLRGPEKKLKEAQHGQIVTDFNNRIQWAAFIAGLVYLFHPMQVGAVAWHSGFRDLLSHFWTLAAINVLLRDQTRRGIGWGTVLFSLSLLSKPSSVAVPVVLLFLTFLLPKDAIKKKPLYIFLGITLFFGILASLKTREIQSAFMIGLDTADVKDRHIIIADVYGFYVRQFFGASPLSADYGRTPPRVLNWDLWRETVPWFFGALIALPFIFWKRWREMFIFGFMFSIPIFPVSGVVAFNFQRISSVADHYLIPALPAFCFFIATFVVRPPKWSGEKYLGWLILPIIAVWAGKTNLRVPDWRDNKTFFQSILKANPYSHSANNYLGFFAFQEKDWPLAEKYFRQATASLPVSAISSGNYAYALLRQNRNQEVVAYLETKVVDPEFIAKNMVHRHVIAVNWLALGLAQANLGQFQKAFNSICSVYRYDPQPTDRIDADNTLRRIQQQLSPQNPQALTCTRQPG